MTFRRDLWRLCALCALLGCSPTSSSPPDASDLSSGDSITDPGQDTEPPLDTPDAELDVGTDVAPDQDIVSTDAEVVSDTFAPDHDAASEVVADVFTDTATDGDLDALEEDVESDVVTWDSEEPPPLTVVLTSPTQIQFGPVEMGQSKFQLVTLQNMGDAPLVISEVSITGSSAFTAQFAGDTVTVDSPSFLPVTANPGGTITIQVRFDPNEYVAVTGSVVFFANTLAAQSGQVIPLSGYTLSTCMEVNTNPIDFGLQLTGGQIFEELVTVENCGPNPLHISRLNVSTPEDLGDPLLILAGVDAFSEHFSVSLMDDAPLPSEDTPIEISGGENLSFVARFTTPDAAPPFNNEAQPPQADGFVVVISDAFHDTEVVSLTGSYLDSFCPIPHIDTLAPNVVSVGTTLSFHGNGSIGILGEISQYSWSLDGPLDSQDQLTPNSENPAVQVVPTTPGTYTIYLTVYDATGLVSCAIASFTFEVLSGPQIEIQLTWVDTDGNAVKGPNAADLDLHLIHPNATGVDADSDGVPDGYFDPIFDCFWYNSIATWSATNPESNPTLSEDASDEGGPEIIVLQQPIDGLTYKIGVHFYPDGSDAAQLAKITIYSLQQLIWESTVVPVNSGDMWEVAFLTWPDKNIQEILSGAGSIKIIPNYPAPF